MTVAYHERMAEDVYDNLDIDNLPDVFAALYVEWDHRDEQSARYVTIWSHSDEWEQVAEDTDDPRTATGTLFCDASSSEEGNDQCDGRLWFGSDEGMPTCCAKHMHEELVNTDPDRYLKVYGIVTGFSEQPGSLPSDWEDLPMQYAPR